MKIIGVGADESVLGQKSGNIDVVKTIAELLKEHGLAASDIAEVVANPGPGSFTGIRIGVAIANAFNWALGRKTVQKGVVPEYGRPPTITPPKKFKI